jgi:hypothetical protein
MTYGRSLERHLKHVGLEHAGGPKGGQATLAQRPCGVESTSHKHISTLALFYAQQRLLCRVGLCEFKFKFRAG